MNRNFTLTAAGQVAGYGNDSYVIGSQSVVSSLEYLRKNESYRLMLKGVWQNLKKWPQEVGSSPNRGPVNATVENLVDWRQDFILTGSHKTRPTYDDLTITQWVFGFIGCIFRKKNLLIIGISCLIIWAT